MHQNAHALLAPVVMTLRKVGEVAGAPIVAQKRFELPKFGRRWEVTNGVGRPTAVGMIVTNSARRPVRTIVE